MSTKVHLVKAMVFSSSRVWIWGLDHKESWMPKNWCFWPVVLEKTLENPLDCKEIQPFNPKGNQSWIFIGRTDAEAPILWPPDVKNWLIGKDPDAGQDWRQEEKWTPEDEMVEWHYRLSGHNFEQAPGIGDGQGSLACCSPWGSQRVGQDWATELKALCPWDFPGKNNGEGRQFLLQGMFPTQRSNPGLLLLLHWQVGSWPLSCQGSPFLKNMCAVVSSSLWFHGL